MHDLEQGVLRVVVNVGVLTEGVDVPHVSCVVLARPCTHASTYVQIVGRVLRAAPGKTEGTLIDLVGASHKHGLPAADREHSLTGKGIELRRGEESDADEPPEERDQPHEQRPVDVLDIALEVIEASRTVVPFVPRPPFRRRRKTGGRTKMPPKPFVLRPDRVLAPPSDNKYAPKTRPALAPRTEGFIYQDRGFWSLRWRELGQKMRTGLGTQVASEARELLQLFRDEGVDALKVEVRKRKRTGCSMYREHDGRYWKIMMWDEKKNRSRQGRDVHARARSGAGACVSVSHGPRRRSA
jgi:hypothetical protein